jgi:DNA-binding helix-hairpin-helix protein with protein kinase domain
MSRLKNIFDQHQRLVVLGKLLGRGGEGAVFEVAGQPELAAKIYHSEKARERQRKISAMVSSDFQSRVSNAAFPVFMLFESDGTFAGFTMRRVGKQKPVHELYSPASRRNEFPSADFRMLVRSALNIARSVAAVHSVGCVIGDLNHSGILVGTDATATLIDCDSFQFSRNGETFYCAVGVPDYTPPELQGRSLDGIRRTPNHDSFGLGVAIFSLLFLGRHPFAGRYLGRGEMPEERAIAEYRFAYSRHRSRTQTEPPQFSPELTSLPSELAVAFEDCFGPDGAKGGRPRPADWIALLESAESQLIKCGASDRHYYFSSAPECPWCKIERAVPGFVVFPSSLVINTAAPANLGHLIAAIRGVTDPGNAPSLLSVMPAVLAAPRRKTNVSFDSSISGFFLSTFAGSTSAFLLGAGSLPPLYGILALIASSYFAMRKHIGSGDRTVQLRQAWDQVERRYNVEGGAGRFVEARRASEARIREYDDLSNEESRRMADLSRRQREMQLRDYLERFSLVNVKLKTIGSVKKATLRSHGISTAADISQRRVENIQGFGAATARILVAWRADLERRFVFDPNRPINPAELAQVKTDINNKRLYLETALKADLLNTRTAVAEIERARKDLASRASAIWLELKQAEAEEKSRVLGSATSRRGVFSVMCCTAFSVALVLGGGSRGSKGWSSPSESLSTTKASIESTAPTVNSSGGRTVIPLGDGRSVPSPAVPKVDGQMRDYLAGVNENVQGARTSADVNASTQMAAPPLDPPREVKPAPEPLAGSSWNASAITLDIAKSRLRELGFAPVEGTNSSLEGLREFKIANHLDPDGRLDEATSQALQSTQAVTRDRSFFGEWAADRACSNGVQLTITDQEARTEGGVCRFEVFLPKQEGWAVRGRCQVGSDVWPATISFTVRGRSLSWSSAKGTSTYYRCRQ